jgi:hypothetical protein
MIQTLKRIHTSCYAKAHVLLVAGCPCVMRCSTNNTVMSVKATWYLPVARVKVSFTPQPFGVGWWIVLGIATTVERNLGNAPTCDLSIHQHQVYFFSGDRFGWCFTRRLYCTTGRSLFVVRVERIDQISSQKLTPLNMPSGQLKVKYRGYTRIFSPQLLLRWKLSQSYFLLFWDTQLYCCRNERRHGNKVQPDNI